MKKIFIAFIGLFLSLIMLQAQTDTMYVMKAGVVINKQSIKLADVDSIIFYNPVPKTVTDIDGNVYHTVTIGSQVWMVENLKTTRFLNGESIPNITDNYSWATLSTGAYCDYDNLTDNSSNYGHLYNWFAVVDSRKIAPTGWHVPTDAEWIILQNYLLANGYNYDSTTTDNKYAKSLADGK